MREYLFRGKRKDNGEWVYGYYVAIGNEHYIFTGKTGLSQVTPAHGLMYKDFERYEVIPETVGQYIEFLDMYRRQIFDGDIIMAFWVGSKQPKKFLIKWGEIWKGWCGKDKHGENIFHTDEKILSEMKIVGNIRDNPELLEA
jgi:uncharacterized phage protein (TIGR01671 family)